MAAVICAKFHKCWLIIKRGMDKYEFAIFQLMADFAPIIYSVTVPSTVSGNKRQVKNISWIQDVRNCVRCVYNGEEDGAINAVMWYTIDDNRALNSNARLLALGIQPRECHIGSYHIQGNVLRGTAVIPPKVLCSTQAWITLPMNPNVRCEFDRKGETFAVSKAFIVS